MKNLILFAFALLAAVGNALFAMGQRKASAGGHTLVVVALAAAVCVVLTVSAILITGGSGQLVSGLRDNTAWILVSGIGLFLTYLGFNLLYSRFGATSYAYYAVVSIVTTSMVVGVLILKERVNIYHGLAGAAALLTVILYSVGNRRL